MKLKNNPQGDIPDFISLYEAAERLDISERTLARWIRNGELRAFRVNNITRISRDDFINFIKSNTTDAGGNHEL